MSKEKLSITQTEDLSMMLLNDGLFTGSSRFFGEGEDEDYVVTYKTLADRIHHVPRQIIESHLEGYDGDQTSQSFKFEHAGKGINMIVVSDDSQLAVWRYATNMMRAHLKWCNGESLIQIKNDKQTRVNLFELFQGQYKAGVR